MVLLENIHQSPECRGQRPLPGFKTLLLAAAVAVALECRGQRPLPGFKGCPLVPFFCMGGVGIKSNDECKSAGLDTRHSLTYNERAHKQNIIYGCATAMIYLFSIALSMIEVLQSIKG